MVCEEIVDTQYEPEYYERVVAELRRRGIGGEELVTMRMFAWNTAGWLNYEKMAWEWYSLGEKDIRKALELQRSENALTEKQFRAAMKYLSQHK